MEGYKFVKSTDCGNLMYAIAGWIDSLKENFTKLEDTEELLRMYISHLKANGITLSEDHGILTFKFILLYLYMIEKGVANIHHALNAIESLILLAPIKIHMA